MSSWKYKFKANKSNLLHFLEKKKKRLVTLISVLDLLSCRWYLTIISSYRNEQTKALVSISAWVYAYGENEKRSKVCTLYLQFIRLLDQVQYHPKTMDCSHLLTAIKSVYIVVAVCFQLMCWTGVYTLFENLICLHLFMISKICKFISKASSKNVNVFKWFATMLSFL